MTPASWNWFLLAFVVVALFAFAWFVGSAWVFLRAIHRALLDIVFELRRMNR